ncbi:hypothetical protein GCG54_00007222 [Colletotrichum gloeosporioides]|uniref:Uncharacterized protein n=1 Tax=Colletotrichum gloeosporioides TaxID=474922 RepID=A0A8H4CN30_COLGL|nr:uncharacterized protein GCG54_00007222 [Colletotrichum gloeosporioides]KAF3806970.1 hypothetical protein GCG54_00007222 [Colletotrichum gloeosporioides]
MDPPARPPRSALLAALRNNGTTEELRGIGYDVDLQGNWLADSLIFTADRLEGSLDNLPLGPRQILERHAAAFMSNAPARPSYVPARSISRPPSLNRPSTTSTWGRPYPDPHLLPRPGTDAWYEYKFGRTARPPPAPTPAPIPSSMTTMPFADSSPAPTAAVPRAGLPASLIMSPESADPSSFVYVGEEYRDDNKDDREDTDDEDADAEDKDEDEDDESYLSTMPVAHGPAPAPAPATAGSYPTPAPVSALPVSGPAAVAGFPALPPPATSAPAPAPAPASAAAAASGPAAAVPGPAAAGYPAIPPPPNFPPIPAGFQLHSARGRYFLTGPDWTGGVPSPPALNFRGIRSLDGEPNENGACRFCACSKWLWFPAFFQRANDPQGLMHTCTRCVCRDKTSNQKDVGQQEWVKQRNQWLVVNRPIMFWLTRTGV